MMSGRGKRRSVVVLAAVLLAQAPAALAETAAPSASQAPSASATASPSPVAAPKPVVNIPAPVPANRTTKARNVPAYPTTSKVRGKRVVYDKSLMTVWLIDEREQVVDRFPVVGRPDRPAAGTYRVYSKSPSSANRIQELTFKNMVRFAHGPATGAPIGFHDIPRTYDGRPIHGESVLGLPLGAGGCVRMATEASKALYAFASIGTPVEVLG